MRPAPSWTWGLWVDAHALQTPPGGVCGPDCLILSTERERGEGIVRIKVKSLIICGKAHNFFTTLWISQVECEGHTLVKFVAKTKCQPKAITRARADWEADGKRRPCLYVYTGKGEERREKDSLTYSGVPPLQSISILIYFNFLHW
jgi:hypothetical protein